MPTPYKFVTPLDFNDQTITKFRIEALASNPLSALIGRVIVNSTTKKLVYHNGDGFVDPTDRAQHTGSPATHVSWGGYKITNLADGTNPADAVNKGQLDKVITVSPTPPPSPVLNQLWVQTP